jgi:Ras family protein
VGVDGYVLVYSIMSRSSFDKIRGINDMLMNMLGDPPELKRVLVGTMLDLEPNGRRVRSATGENF